MRVRRMGTSVRQRDSSTLMYLQIFEGVYNINIAILQYTSGNKISPFDVMLILGVHTATIM